MGSYCDVAPNLRSLPQLAGTKTSVVWPTLSPTLDGSNGDWVAYNVTPFADGWDVRIETSNYASTFSTKHVDVSSNGSLSVSFALSLWATATGRVLDAETGLPIEGTKVDGGYDRAQTDARGNFKLKCVGADSWVYVGDSSKNYVTQVFHVTGVAEGTNIVLPDARLRKGGWISGRAVPPADSPIKQPRAEIRQPDERGSPQRRRGSFRHQTTSMVTRTESFGSGRYRLARIASVPGTIWASRTTPGVPRVRLPASRSLSARKLPTSSSRPKP